jgi:ABC-2 type transport system ATP-binding protein
MTSTPPAADPILSVNGAVKRYGTVTALDGATLDVRSGELLGLLGPNGAGKTTLIRAIAGRLTLDSGTVTLFGRTLTRTDARPEIGVVPQEIALYPLLTARENLDVFGRLYGVSGAALAARVRWALDWSGLADRAGEPVKRFSGGMKRRLNIACSLLHEPTLVLLDEPTVGVDPQSRERIYEMLQALRDAGVSIVLTTHHLEEAEQRCERVVIIDRGRIVASGTVRDLVRETLGGTRRLTVTTSTPVPADAAMGDGLRIADPHRRVIVADVADVGVDVPRVLHEVRRTGVGVDDVHLAGRTLQDVFIARTGRELRE